MHGHSHEQERHRPQHHARARLAAQRLLLRVPEGRHHPHRGLLKIEERQDPPRRTRKPAPTQILEYLVKNANKNFHQAANKASFQKCILHLLRRVRGKSNILKELRSNTDNWNKIEAKVLFLVQLWYDAFMLDEAVYNNIVSNYKTLRKENVVFPPRLPNEKNLIFVKTESPIM